MQSKKYHFVEQGLKELKAKEQKEKNSMEIESLVAYLSPLANSFNFNLSFLILFNIISNNIPIPFP